MPAILKTFGHDEKYLNTTDASSIKHSMRPLSSAASNVSSRIITFIEKKIRNLEKRKTKLLCVQQELEAGKTLDEDQVSAVQQINCVETQIELAKEFLKNITQIVQEEPEIKNKNKPDYQLSIQRAKCHGDDIESLLAIQEILSCLGKESIRQDFRRGLHGAIALSEEQFDLIDECYGMVCPTREEIVDSNQWDRCITESAIYSRALLQYSSEKIPSKAISFCELRNLVDNILSCNYFDKDLPDSGVYVSSVASPTGTTSSLNSEQKSSANLDHADVHNGIQNDKLSTSKNSLIRAESAFSQLVAQTNDTTATETTPERNTASLPAENSTSNLDHSSDEKTDDQCSSLSCDTSTTSCRRRAENEVSSQNNDLKSDSKLGSSTDVSLSSQELTQNVPISSAHDHATSCSPVNSPLSVSATVTEPALKPFNTSFPSAIPVANGGGLHPHLFLPPSVVANTVASAFCSVPPPTTPFALQTSPPYTLEMPFFHLPHALPIIHTPQADILTGNYDFIYDNAASLLETNNDLAVGDYFDHAGANDYYNFVTESVDSKSPPSAYLVDTNSYAENDFRTCNSKPLDPNAPVFVSKRSSHAALATINSAYPVHQKFSTPGSFPGAFPTSGRGNDEMQRAQLGSHDYKRLWFTSQPRSLNGCGSFVLCQQRQQYLSNSGKFRNKSNTYRVRRGQSFMRPKQICSSVDHNTSDGVTGS